MEAERRSGNYGKSSWDSNYIQRLTTPYSAIEYVEKAEKLKEHVKIMIEGTTDLLAQLELIDDLQRLDVSHYFEDSVRNSLEKIYGDDKNMIKESEEEARVYVRNLKRGCSKVNSVLHARNRVF